MNRRPLEAALSQRKRQEADGFQRLPFYNRTSCVQRHIVAVQIEPPQRADELLQCEVAGAAYV